MKISFLLLVILVCSSLFAQFQPFYILDEEPGFEQFLGTESCVVDGDIVYWTYLKKDGDLEEVIFAKKANGNINYTVLTDNQNNIDSFTKPSITMLENGFICIATADLYQYGFEFLRAFYSYDGGNSFYVAGVFWNDYILDDNEPVIKAHNDYVDIVTIIDDFSYNPNSLTHYEIFTEHETDENGNALSPGMAYNGISGDFWGPVHSNDDIWISEFGGWPVFHDSVTTTGQIFSNGAIPYASVFLGGYAENVAHKPINMSQTLQNGTIIGMGVDIVYVKMNGSSAELMYGNINLVGAEEFDVYSWYPKDATEANAVINAGGNWFEDSDVVWTNQVAIYDTIWSSGGSVNWGYSATFWIPDGELWIEGEVAGSVTFGCANNVYIVNDISYANTPLGMSPDTNPSDYFGLVSEKSIILKYKHRDPFDPDYGIVTPNCDGHVYLYGAYAALGQGTIPQDDGIISFEYQHPHGSTPDFIAPSPCTGNDTLYTYIDFHKFIFPQNPNIPENLLGFNLHGNNPQTNMTCGFPYESPEYINSYPNNDPQDYVFPYGTDYPWYNPVWPESSDNIVNERGTIHLWGCRAQIRKGYLHRSGSDDFNHPPGNHEWDIENFHFDGDHGSSGYQNRDYHYDTRFLEHNPPNYPTTGYQQQFGRLIQIYRSTNDGEDFIKHMSFQEQEEITALHFDVHEQKYAVCYQIVEEDSIHLQYSEDAGITFTEYLIDCSENQLRKVIMLEESVILLTASTMEDIIYEYFPASGNCTILASFISQNHLSDLINCESGSLIYVREIAGNDPVDLDFHFTNQVSILGGQYLWQSELNNLSQEFSNLSLNVNEADDVYLNLLFTEPDATDEWGKLYTTSGYLEGLTGVLQYEIIKPAASLSNYPNPFNPSTIISFELATESTEDTEISIYNLKGQKVKTFLINSSTVEPINSVVWNGEDDSGKSVSSGIYFYKLKAGKFEKTKKCLLMK